MRKNTLKYAASLVTGILLTGPAGVFVGLGIDSLAIGLCIEHGDDEEAQQRVIGMAISGAIDGVVGARGVCDDILETAYSTGVKSIDFDDGFKRFDLSKDFDSLNYNKTLEDLMSPEDAARYNQYWDDLEKTRLNVVDEATDILDEIGESVPNVSSKPNSTTLRKQLVESGISVPDYPNAAHHIVAGNSPKASEARAIMQKFGIDINDASNGVFLPTKKE